MTPEGPLRLISIRFSHYCEKVRWALDYAQLPFVEESHAPILAWRATLSTAGSRTVPILVTPHETLKDSTQILHWVDGQKKAPPLFGEGEEGAEIAAFEDLMDRKVGPAVRRLAYFHLLDQPETVRELLASAATGWEAAAAKRLFPLLRTIIVRGLKIDPAGAERSLASLDQCFTTVEQKLADGRPFLMGDRLTAADLSFASLASLVLLPELLTPLLPPLERAPDGFRRLVETFRARPGGRFGLRLYQEARGRTSLA